MPTVPEHHGCFANQLITSTASLNPVVCIRLPWFLGYRHYLEYLHEQTHSRFLQNMVG